MNVKHTLSEEVLTKTLFSRGTSGRFWTKESHNQDLSVVGYLRGDVVLVPLDLTVCVF